MQSDATKITRLLKTARGQIDGLLKMVEDDRYCIDISHQLMATQAILGSVNRQILRDHLDGCVRAAFDTDERDEKINEVIQVLEKLAKST